MPDEGHNAAEGGGTTSTNLSATAAERPKMFRFRPRTSKSTQVYGSDHVALDLPGGLHSERNSRLLPECYVGEIYRGNDKSQLLHKDELPKARTQGLQESLKAVRSCTEETVADATLACIGEVSRYINGWRFGEGEGIRGDIGKSDLIPFAIVDAGLHLGDRRWFVEQIKKGLTGTGRRSCSEAVVVLRCQDCTSVEASLSSIHRQCLLLGGTESRRPLFMDAFEEWYSSLFPSASEPLAPALDVGVAGVACVERAGGGVRRRRRRSPVVVVLEDMEGMNKQVLRDVMAVLAQPPSSRASCSSSAAMGIARAREAMAFRGRGTGRGRGGGRGSRREGRGGERGGGRSGRGVPLAFVALASTAVGFPLERLSPASRHVSAKVFPLPPAKVLEDALYEKLCVQGRLSFVLGPNVLGWLGKSFEHSHHSLSTLSREIQRAVFEHFSRPASYLCLQHCRPWLDSMGYAERRRVQDATWYFSFQFQRDAARMPAEHLDKLLGGPPRADGGGKATGSGPEQTRTRLSVSEAYEHVKQAAARQASTALRLWFFHQVTLTLSRAEGSIRGKGRGDVRFNSSARYLTVLLANGESRKYYQELTKAAEALGLLSPGEVTTLLRQLLQAIPLPSCNDSEGSRTLVNGITSIAAAASSSSSETVVTPSAGEKVSETSTDEMSGPSVNRVHQSFAGGMLWQSTESVQTTGDVGASHPSSRSQENCTSVVGSRENFETTTMMTNGDSQDKVPGNGDSQENVPGNSDSQNDAGSVSEDGYTRPAATALCTDATSSRLSSYRMLSPLPTPPAYKTGNDSASDGWGRVLRPIPSFKPPPAVAGLDPLEAAYIGSSVQNLLRLWKRAEEQGWAKVDVEDSLPWESSSVADGSRTAPRTSTSSGGAGGDCSNKSMTSRGNRLFNSAVNHGAGVSRAGVSPQEQGITGNDDSENVNAQGGKPPEAVLASGEEVAGSSERPGNDFKGLKRACLVREVQLLFLHVMGEARDCPLSAEGTPIPPPLANNTSVLRNAHVFDSPKLLQAALCPQSRARVDEAMIKGAGKGDGMREAEKLPRSDTCILYSCYRRHGKIIDRSDWFKDFRHAIQNARKPQTRYTEDGHGNASKEEEGSAKATPGELLARFKHASSELAFLGYVNPYKRRRKEQAGTAGPKGAVTRLVYAYTMEGGAL